MTHVTFHDRINDDMEYGPDDDANLISFNRDEPETEVLNPIFI